MKNQLTLIIVSATLAFTSAILPAKAAECSECEEHSYKCLVGIGIDTLSPITYAKILVGAYNESSDCKWLSEHKKDCKPCSLPARDPRDRNRIDQ